MGRWKARSLDCVDWVGRERWWIEQFLQGRVAEETEEQVLKRTTR